MTPSWKDVGLGIGSLALTAGLLAGVGRGLSLERYHKTERGISLDASLDFIQDYRGEIEAASHQVGLPPELVASVILNENADRPHLEDWKDGVIRYGTSSDFSYGVGQVKLSTAMMLDGVDTSPESFQQHRAEYIQRLADPVQNIGYVARYISYLKLKARITATPRELLQRPEAIATLGSMYAAGESNVIPGRVGLNMLILLATEPVTGVFGTIDGATVIATVQTYVRQRAGELTGELKE